MGRLAALGFMILIAATPAVPAAQGPSALAQSMAGEWEFDGVPGAKAPLRQCIADMRSLGQFEHRGRSCQQHVTSSSAASTVVDYSCGGGEFGHSEIEAITPRSLRISTQGISESLPFNYVLQARRIGECTKSASPSRH